MTAVQAVAAVAAAIAANQAHWVARIRHPILLRKLLTNFH